MGSRTTGSRSPGEGDRGRARPKRGRRSESTEEGEESRRGGPGRAAPRRGPRTRKLEEAPAGSGRRERRTVEVGEQGAQGRRLRGRRRRRPGADASRERRDEERGPDPREWRVGDPLGMGWPGRDRRDRGRRRRISAGPVAPEAKTRRTR